MSQIFNNIIEQNMTGTSGTPETISLKPGYKFAQITITNRSSGNATIDSRAYGGDAFENEATLDLANVRTYVIKDKFVDELQFDVSVTGTYTVKILQWLS